MTEWHITDKNEKIPCGRVLICYCPNWSDTGYQIATFDGMKFSYEDQSNEMFDRHVEQWALFMAAD